MDPKEILQHYSAEDLDNSRKFDGDLSCSSSVGRMYIQDFKDYHFQHYGKPKFEQMMILYCNLFLTWSNDPKQPLSISKTRNSHKKHPRYNKFTTATITDVVKDFLDKELVAEKLGYQDLGSGKSRNTRIIATDILINMWFDPSPFEVFDLRTNPLAETIQMKDEKLVEVEQIITEQQTVIDKDGIYTTFETEKKIKTGNLKKIKTLVDYPSRKEADKMRQELGLYNDLLTRNHIDLGYLKLPYIERAKPKGKKQRDATKVYINQSRKHVKRVFNKESFKYGGRFYGGFWQEINKKYRQHIRINGERTIEIDYSGFHIALLYAKEQISYWDTFGSKADPYDVHVPEINDPDDYKRWLIKNVMLMAVNANDVETMCDAIQFADIPDDITKPEGLKLTDELLMDILDKLKDKHEPIARYFCSGAGISLQNTDSKITAWLINQYTAHGIPLLAVHDSYIVQEKYAYDLWEDMQKAVQNTLLEDGINLTITADMLPEDQQWVGDQPPYIRAVQMGYTDGLFNDEEEQGGEEHQAMIKLKNDHLIWCPEYVKRLNNFNAWLRRTKNN